MGQTLLPYGLVSLVLLCMLTLKIDVDLLRQRGRRRIMLLSCLAALLVYASFVFPIELYGFRYGRTPLWQKHILVLALVVAYGIAIYFKHTGEYIFYERFKRRWTVNLLKIVTYSIFIYFAYIIYCLSPFILTWPYHKGSTPLQFIWRISFSMLGIGLPAIFGTLTGLAFWLISSRIRKAQQATTA